MSRSALSRFRLLSPSNPVPVGSRLLRSVVLTAAVCGGLAMISSGTSGQRHVAPAPRLVNDPSPKLVEQLGSADFAHREAAQGQLRELGAKAEVALKAGQKSDSPEVRDRCGRLLDRLRADRLGNKDSPVWQKFKTVAGDGDDAWKLYIRAVGTRKRGEMLLAAVDDPKAAAASYDRECEEIATAIKYSHIGGAVPPPKPPGLDVRDVTADDLAALLFLGTLPRGDQKQPDKESVAAHGGALTEALRGEAKSAYAKLYAAWAEPRPEYYASSLGIGLNERLPVLVGVARKALAVKDRPPWAGLKGPALQFLGLHGTADDIPLVMQLAYDKTECDKMEFSKIEGGALGPWRPAVKNADVVVQVRDLAVIAALRLHKKRPGDFGFEQAIVQDGGPPPVANWIGHLGFCDDADRTAAHKKAKEWLDEQKK